jgi:hypothetical protein
MGPSAVSSRSSSPIPDITPEEAAAGASLIERPQHPQSSQAPSAASEPEPAAAKLVEQHPPPLAQLPPKKDWCGSDGTGWVPDGALGVDWSDACRTHDECYATPGANKYLCDYALQEDMSLACAAQDGGILCEIFAGAYFHGVRVPQGQDAFDRAQEAAKAKAQ